MKIGDPTYKGEEVHLPVEVISLVTAHLASSYNLDSQKSLWACCLVSKAWYAASISHLYCRPHLSPRNFDLFTRTICPRLKSRKARIGLEDFIRHIDMREIAYESSNSLTARLINRTKSSLEGFLSPAVTFSVSSLASLSKCANLQLLDMSRDHYSLTLYQLLGAIGQLEHLTFLGLPKDILWEKHRPLQGNLQWPNKLSQLFPECQMKSEFVQRLEIGEPTSDTPRGLNGGLFDILRVFPGLKTATIPTGLARHTLLLPNREVEERARETSVLETLNIKVTFQPYGGFDNPESDLLFANITKLFIPPKLRRLVVHGNFFIIDSAAKEKLLGEFSKIIEDRATPGQRKSSGIFLLGSKSHVYSE